MALTGSKQVQGFDIGKHAKLKHGNLIDGASEEEDVVEE